MSVNAAANARSISKAVRLHEQAARLEKDGKLVEAEARCRVALDIFEQEGGPASADVANVLHSLGEILHRQRKYREAEACAHRAAILIEPLLPQFGGSVGVLIQISSLILLGTALRDQGRYSEARTALVRAIEIATSIAGLPAATIRALNEFGVLCKFAGWYEDGERAYLQALGLARPLYGEESLETATILHNIGGMDHARGLFEMAQNPARRAFEIRRALLGESHPDVLADAVAYAAILDGLGRWKESRPIYEHAIAEYERMYGPENYEVAAALHNLAAVELADGNIAKAEALARRTVALKHKLLGAGHPDTAFSAMNLCIILRERGGRDEAGPMLEKALATFERTLPGDHPNVVRCRMLLV
jgi:tetratricopeptide (TPR) repeat protein